MLKIRTFEQIKKTVEDSKSSPSIRNIQKYVSRKKRKTA